MSDNKNYDLDEIMEELSDRVHDMFEEVVQDALFDQVEDAVTCAVQDCFAEALSESLSHFEFVLQDGTKVIPKQYMRLLSPDKTKVLLCFGGLRVYGTSLNIQTRTSCWETIAVYQTKEDAVQALLKVKNAMDNNLSEFEL